MKVKRDKIRGQGGGVKRGKGRGMGQEGGGLWVKRAWCREGRGEVRGGG